MKKILSILFLVGVLFGQSMSVEDSGNSSTTVLDSTATFTGVASEVFNYSGLTVNVLLDHAGTTPYDNNTLTVKFGKNSAYWDRQYTYTLKDSVKYEFSFPILAPYYQVTLENDTVAMDELRLSSILHKNSVVNYGMELGATDFFGVTDTVTTRVDSVYVTNAISWIEGNIISDDSIEVARDTSFTSGETWIITENTVVDLGRWDANAGKYLYIRRYGADGTPRFYLRLLSR